jgi:hypothetical protein
VKGIIVIATLLCLTACDKGGSNDNSSNPNNPNNPTTPVTPTPVTPAPVYDQQGTVYSSECDEYTLTEVIADGQGGEEERTTQDSTECGYEDPIITVETVQDTGDRFDRVEFKVSATHYGEDIDWDFDIEYGTVVKTEDGIEIASDGRLGTHVGIIAGEEYQYTFVREPQCEGTIEDYDSFFIPYDCQGYRQGAGTPFYIWYGEPDVDTRIVYWDVIQMYADARYDGLEGRPLIGEPNDYTLYRSEHLVKIVNERFEQWGIHVRIRLIGTYATISPTSLTYHKFIEDGTLPPADFIANNQTAGAGYCGFAGQTGKFRDHKMKHRYLTFQNGCSADTWLHEMGHAVGLGHGPQTENPGGGVTFPDFAQGAGGGSVCGPHYDMMTYGGGWNSKSFTSPYVDCERHYPDNYKQYHGTPSGDTTFSATGYAINRVRYDVSLVHDEWEHPEATDNPLEAMVDPDYNEPVYQVIYD